MNASSPPQLRATRLLDQMRERLRYAHYSLSTERSYVYWVRAFVRFHRLRHPREMGGAEVQAFLSWLANRRGAAVSTHKQALAALIFLYKRVLNTDLPWMQDIGRPRTPQRLPVVMSRAEVQQLLNATTGEHQLVFRLLYGTGMRKMECLRLRVKDVDFERRLIVIREGKGNKDRITMLPSALRPDLRRQLEYAKALCNGDRALGRPGVETPPSVTNKYPRAGESWAWFWVFPSDHESIDPRSGIRRRHHLYEGTLGAAIKRAAARAQIAKPISTHSCDILSRPIWSSAARTFGRFRSCLATTMWTRQ